MLFAIDNNLPDPDEQQDFLYVSGISRVNVRKSKTMEIGRWLINSQGKGFRHQRSLAGNGFDIR